MSSNLSKHILTTIAYYDVLGYPLTAFEAWKYLTAISNDNDADSIKHSLADVINELESEKLKKFVAERHGFYFLKGRAQLVEQRIRRNKIAQKKYRILLRAVRWLRFVPYVRLIAVTGRLAMKNTQAESDLDLLVVLKHGKIFTGRTLVTLLTHLLGKRRYKDKIADRICLNYFVTDKSLEINLKDLFSSSEYAFIFPVFGFETFREFQRKNDWIKKYKINYQTQEAANLKLIKDAPAAKFARKIGEALLDLGFIEKNLKKWQVRRIMNDPRTHRKRSLIIADDESLVFLPKPQSPRVFEKFQKRVKELASGKFSSALD